jgi:hypothetical protein
VKKGQKFGTCKLTGLKGKYVKSHIVPQAFTIGLRKGHPLYQKGAQGKYFRKWSSWYDSELVTKEGEVILAKYDDWAAKILADKKLVWTSWGETIDWTFLIIRMCTSISAFAGLQILTTISYDYSS